MRRHLLRSALVALIARSAVAQPAPPIRGLALPQVFAASQYEFVLLTQASAANLENDAHLAAFFGGCRRRLAIPASDSVAVVRSRPWEWTAGGTADPSAITILVSRASRDAVTCDVPDAVAALAFARGYRVTVDTAYPYDANITSLRASRGARTIDPVDEERTSATRLTTRGIVTVGGGLLRLSIPLDEIAPDSSGVTADLVIEIIAPDSTRSARVTLPWSRLRPLWEQSFAHRSRRSSALEMRNAPALARMAGPNLTPSDRIAARVDLGVNFAEAGDTAAARVALGAAVESEPCLTLATDAPAAAREVMRTLHRRPDRCTASLPRTVVVATVLPGFGHTRGLRRLAYASAMAGFVAGTLAASQSKSDEATALYRRYLTVDGNTPSASAAEAARLYDRAEETRLAGSRLVVVGATAWVASILEAAWTERRQARRLQRVQEVRPSARAIGIAPHATAGRVGFALTFF